MKRKMIKPIAILAASAITASIFAGCTSPASDTESKTEKKTELSVSTENTDTNAEKDSTFESDLYFTQQEIRKSPEWVTKLSAAKDAEQLIVVAGIDKTTAYVTMHEKKC